MLVSDVNLLHGNDDEADTRIVFHLDHLDLFVHRNVIVPATDSDVAVILLTNNTVFENCKLWMGIGGRDFATSRRYLDITNISKSINDIIYALPGLYSSTGIAYNPTFYNKGKIKPFECIELLASFGETPITEEMICEATKVTKLSEARYMHFKIQYKPKVSARPFDGIKSITRKPERNTS